MADFLGWPAVSGTPVTVAATSTLLCAANTKRKQLHLYNKHATTAVWLNFGAAAVSGSKFRLAAGEEKVISVPDDGSENWLCGEINAIAETGTADVAVAEVSRP
jgi:hypothetical protein